MIRSKKQFRLYWIWIFILLTLSIWIYHWQYIHIHCHRYENWKITLPTPCDRIWLIPSLLSAFAIVALIFSLFLPKSPPGWLHLLVLLLLLFRLFRDLAPFFLPFLLIKRFRFYFLVFFIPTIAMILLESFVQIPHYDLKHLAFLTRPTLMLLNSLGLSLVVISLAAMIGKLKPALYGTILLLVGIYIADDQKLRYLDSPLFLDDALSLATYVRMPSLWNTALPMVLALIATFSLLLWLDRSLPFHPKPLSTQNRIIYGIIALTAWAWLYHLDLKEIITFFNKQKIDYDIENHKKTAKLLGLPASIVFSAKMRTRPPAPSLYSKDAIVALRVKASYRAKPMPTKVIVYQIESFLDPKRLPNQYQPTSDPLPFFHSLKKNPNAHFFFLQVPVYGGQTVQTEFEILTSLPSHWTGGIAYHLINQPTMYSLARYAQRLGYTTMAITLTRKMVWTSNHAYRVLGFQTHRAKEDYPSGAIPLVGHFPSDLFLVKEVLHYAALATPQRQWIFAVGAQTHYPWPKNNPHTGELSAYLSMLRGIDKAIQTLINAIDHSPYPALLLIYGDHLPPLPALKELIKKHNPRLLYQTPAMLYANYRIASLPFQKTSIPAYGLWPTLIQSQHWPDPEDYYTTIYNLQKKPVAYKRLFYDLFFGYQYFFND